jgi:hypothetical protein
MSMILTNTQSALAYGVAGDSQGLVHETLITNAMDLYQFPLEMENYVGNIRLGATHEDKYDLVDDEYGFAGSCVTQVHFWDADKGPDDPVDNTYNCEDIRNSWQKAQVIWGMALGQYRAGNKAAAYTYLGHVAHLLADQTVPAHAHEDAHPMGDIYEEWMTDGPQRAQLTPGEILMLQQEGPVVIPELPNDKSYGPYTHDNPIGPLYYLFYSTSQVGDYFPSDTYGGDDGWNPAYGDWIGDLYADLNLPPLHTDDLEGTDDNGEILQDIRFYSYFYAIRSTAALFDLFWQEASRATALTVVIDRVDELDCHDGDETYCDSEGDFYVEISIDGFWYRNEGEQTDNDGYFDPGWAFGRDVGVTNTAVPVVIQLWEEDNWPNDDDPSAIDPNAVDRRDLDLWINLETGVITEQQEWIILGNCGDQLVSEGHPDTDDRSKIWYRILLPNIPPEVEVEDDKEANEGDDVTLTGSFTDPNTDDSWTYEWQMVSNPNGQSIPGETGSALPNTPIEFTFIPWDDGDYVFSLTVTDSYGASDTEEVTVTVLNVPPVASIDSLADELGAEIGVDVPVALIGLEVNLEGSFTDAGYSDNHTANIYWGDGNSDPETAFNLFVDSTGWQLGYLHDTHIYATPGNFTITLEVIDDDGGVDTQMIPIEIVDASGAIEYVMESLEQHADNPDIQAALDRMQGENGGAASNGALDMLEQGNLNAALEMIKQALEYMEAAEAADPNLDLIYDKGLLSLAAKSVTVGVIVDATAVADSQNKLLKIQESTALVAEGDVLLAIPNYVGAVDKYQEAVRKVQGIS